MKKDLKNNVQRLKNVWKSFWNIIKVSVFENLKSCGNFWILTLRIITYITGIQGWKIHGKLEKVLEKIILSTKEMFGNAYWNDLKPWKVMEILMYWKIRNFNVIDVLGQKVMENLKKYLKKKWY